MFNQRNIILTIGAVVLMVLLYLVVLMMTEVEDPPAIEGSDIDSTEVAAPPNNHEIKTDLASLSPYQLKDSLGGVENQEKKANFAHHLSTYYRSIDQIDSSAYYEGLAANNFPNEENLLNAGAEYFNAFGVAEDEVTAKQLSNKSTEYLNRVLAISPDHEGAKTMLAILSIASGNTSDGARILREVLVTNPDNEDALYNLGVVALQSGDFNSAAQQFESIIKLDSTQVRAYFYLALCYKETDRTAESILLFEKVKELDSSPEVQADVDAYLDEIK